MLNYQSATEIMSQVLTKSTGCFKTALTEKIRHYPGIQYVYNISDVMRVRIYIYICIYIYTSESTIHFGKDFAG